MKCKNCSGQLVLQETSAYNIDENGVYDQSEPNTGTTTVVCSACQALHEYDPIHKQGDKVTIALAVNSDPVPHAVITIIMRAQSTGPAIREYTSTHLLGIIILDEDEGEVDRFITNIQDHD